MKSLISFLHIVLTDMEHWCRISTTRDRKTISRRIEKEGLSFLTISLPAFSRDLEKCLDEGCIPDDSFASFNKDSSGFPRLFGEFLRSIFDPTTRVLLDAPCVICISNLRQFTLMWAKIDIPCTLPRVKAALKNYVQCDKDVEQLVVNLPNLVGFQRLSGLLFSDWFSKVDSDIYNGDLFPKHGPGTTADRTIGNSKWSYNKWTERLERVLPYRDYLYSTDIAAYYDDTPVDVLEPEAEPPVRVITVPKTQKTPRIIAIEPVYTQFVQQGILDSMVRNLRDTIPDGFLNWHDQEPNKLLAREGSLDGFYCTLDLSDASDRVSYEQVMQLIWRFPHLADAVDASRSKKARVPGYEDFPLSKFASMGSALCFPFESCVFLTLVFLGIEHELGHELTREDIINFSGKVRVYGDDIVVPVRYMRSVIGKLEAFGLKVNRHKSFGGRGDRNGHPTFRESCGGDYFGGVDVSVVRLRSLLPTKRRDAAEIISTVSLRNQLYKIGFWRSVSFLDNLLENLIDFPTVAEESPALGRHSFIGLLSCDGYDVNLQLPLVRAFVVDSRVPENEISGYAALAKCLLFLEKRGEGLPVLQEDHLRRSGRPFSVGIKRRWVHSG